MTGTLDVHPLAKVVPAMLTDEFIALVNDIKNNGIKQPIILYENMILDGRHRAKACAELGIEAATEEFLGTKDEAEALVLSLNVHRRHLTLEQKQKIIKCELLSDPQQSDRAIAKKAKVDHKTVADVRKKAEEGGEIPHHEARVGVDGVKQPAKKPGATKPVLYEGAAVCVDDDTSTRVEGATQMSTRQYRERHKKMVADAIKRCIRAFDCAVKPLLTEEREHVRDEVIAGINHLVPTPEMLAARRRQFEELRAFRADGEREGGAP